ncbi:unnamed protein product, partial [Urochloa humidicola]
PPQPKAAGDAEAVPASCPSRRRLPPLLGGQIRREAGEAAGSGWLAWRGSRRPALGEAKTGLVVLAAETSREGRRPARSNSGRSYRIWRSRVERAADGACRSSNSAVVELQPSLEVSPLLLSVSAPAAPGSDLTPSDTSRSMLGANGALISSRPALTSQSPSSFSVQNQEP